jgi:hypothetical protein
MADRYLGEFTRGPAVFFVYRTGAEPPAYRIDFRDNGGGPSEVCNFVDEPEAPVTWIRNWDGDEWCLWILAEARKRIEDPAR